VDLTHDGLFHVGGGTGGRADRLASVERELQQARAEALGRTGERLQKLLDQVAALDHRLDELLAEADLPVAVSRLGPELDARNRLRDEAMQVRQQLVIQREALGFRRQAAVEQCYPVPDRRRLLVPAGDPGRAP
jgi:hypothetical protein